MNKNYTIKSIAIPVVDENDKQTGEYINLEVISIEKLKAIVPVGDGATMVQESLYVLCYENDEGNPKKLHLISADTNGKIEITKIEKYHGKTNEFRGYDRTHRGKRRTKSGNDNRPDNGNSQKQVP